MDPRPARAPAPYCARSSRSGKSGKRGRRTAAARPWGGRRPPLRLAAPPPPSRAACPKPRAQPAPVLSHRAGSRKREDAQGRDPSPRPPADPGRAGVKPRPRRERTPARVPPGRGEAGPGPFGCPRPRPSDPAPGAGLPARGHKTARAPRQSLQLSDEQSQGKPTRAGGDVFCPRGCCRRRGCLKLAKLRASERLPPAGNKRERNSENARVTDAKTLQKTPPSAT